jgi:NAD(P)-dependent dehydrogenase (short-subunit alcohol dehydrogenase family)
MLLRDKVAVIYGAGGGIGGAVVRVFAREGAEVFLTGRRLAPVEAVASDVVAAGGSAGAAQVDALDEQAVDEHLQSVIETAGRLDISFNAVGYRTRRFWVSRWSSWMSSSSRCRSRPTRPRTS